MVAVPTTDYVSAEFTKCLVQLMMKLTRDGIDADARIRAGTSVHIGREYLAEAAVTEGFTHVLWIDSDMTFGPGIVDDLLWCGKDMVCGAFVSRRPPYTPCIYSSLVPGRVDKIHEFGTEPFKVAGCGFACVLTAVSVLKDVQMKFGDCFTPTTDFGEDLAFCDRVRQIGGEIWCEPTVRPGHIAHVPIHAGDDLFKG